MAKDEIKIVGYFAVLSQQKVLCDGDACIIASTQSAMNKYVRVLATQSDDFQIRKTRFGEIMDGISRGGAYAFDEKSYKTFSPLATNNGGDLKCKDLSVADPDMHFIVVKKKRFSWL